MARVMQQLVEEHGVDADGVEYRGGKFFRARFFYDVGVPATTVVEVNHLAVGLRVGVCAGTEEGAERAAQRDEVAAGAAAGRCFA